MRTPRDYSSFQPVRLYPDETRCPLCNRPITRVYNDVRHVAFLKERLEIAFEVKHCGQDACPYLFPRFLQTRVLPKYEYGLDVIAFIGHQRLRDHRGFPAIGEALRHDHHLQISDREVEYLFTQYVALTCTPVADDPARLAKLRQQGRLIVSLDAAQPEADRESLWILRDTLSGEILDGFSALSVDAARLVRALEKVKALGVPIVGVVSDGQNIIVDAVATALPGVPHQLCQFHFLKDLAKPVTSQDRELAAEVKQELRGLNAFEKAADPNRPKGPQTPEIKAPKSVTLGAEREASGPAPGRPRTRVRLLEAQTLAEGRVVSHVCQIVRAILTQSGRYPLEAPGLEIHDMIRQVAETLHEGLQKRGPCSFSSSASTSVTR
jgi:hypothetical protein